MDIARFEDLLDCHGGVLARWPAAERAAAEALLAASPAARARLDEMRIVETVLQCPIVGADTAAVDRIAARATRHRQETRARLVAARAGVGAAAAAVLALGVLVGGMLAPPAQHDFSPDRVVATALDAGGAGDVE